MEKYYRTGQATDENLALAHCVPDTQDYKHTHSACVKLTAFPLLQWLHELTQCYLTRTLSVMLHIVHDHRLHALLHTDKFSSEW